MTKREYSVCYKMYDSYVDVIDYLNKKIIGDLFKKSKDRNRKYTWIEIGNMAGQHIGFVNKELKKAEKYLAFLSKIK